MFAELLYRTGIKIAIVLRRRDRLESFFFVKMKKMFRSLRGGNDGKMIDSTVSSFKLILQSRELSSKFEFSEIINMCSLSPLALHLCWKCFSKNKLNQSNYITREQDSTIIYFLIPNRGK